MSMNAATEADLTAALVAESADVCTAEELLAPLHGTSPRVERASSHRRRWIGPLAAAAAVVAVVTTTWAVSNDRHGHAGRPTTTDLVPTSFGRLTLLHPTTWRFVPDELVTAGPAGGHGFLTNQAPVAQCTTSANHDRTCGPPVTRLKPGGVLVTVTERYMGQDKITANATIAGSPAQTSEGDVAARCPAGATYALSAAINIPGSTLFVTSCAADNTAQTRDTLQNMLATATRNDLVPADAQQPAPGACAQATGSTVRIDVNPDTPAPRCVIVTSHQRLEVVNTSDHFNQGGSDVTVSWAPYPPRSVPIEGETTFDRPFGEYLAPGIHFLHLSLYGRSSAEIWLR